MTSTTKSRSGIKARTFAYENFQGLDTSRDITSLDTGKQQHLSKMVNATCDWRGQMVRDPSAKFRKGDFVTKHIKFFADNETVWAEQTGSGITLRSDRDHT